MRQLLVMVGLATAALGGGGERGPTSGYVGGLRLRRGFACPAGPRRPRARPGSREAHLVHM
jgi:hypothetical protein